jgi:hypothetical protein
VDVRLALVLPLLLLAAAGCGGGSSQSTGRSAGGELIRYERRGGFAYSDVVVTVDGDGHGVRTSSDRRVRRAPFTLSPAQLASLRAALRDADIAHQRSSTTPVPADGYEYTFRAGGRTVRFVQGELPPALVRVTALLEGRAYAA